MLDQTKVRRTVIILIYIAIFIAIGVVVYFIKKPGATCFDKIQNQGEKAVDCGGPCNPCTEVLEAEKLVVKEMAFANGGNGTYDVVAKISNPNNSVGAKEFSYKFTVKNSSGETIATRNGTSFILPGDFRYIAAMNLSAEGKNATPLNVDVSIEDVKWANLQGVGKPQIGVYEKKFEKASSGESNEVSGIIRNESGYDLKEIGLVVVLRDAKDNIVGINATQKDSVRNKEERDFLFVWPYDLETDVQKIEVDAQSNVFDSQNFSIVN